MIPARRETPEPLRGRIAELVSRFEEIGSAQVADLPIYNRHLVVEAVGFEPFGDGWIGALVTPWFMAAVILPRDKIAIDEGTIGQKCRERLPCGERTFSRCGDEFVGAYETLSLHSTMSEFGFHEAARVAAIEKLAVLLRSTGPPDAKRDLERSTCEKDRAKTP